MNDPLKKLVKNTAKNTTKILECVPNFSEGRDKDKIEAIVNPFRQTTGVKLLDYQSDPAHNRLVVTVCGTPEAVIDALVESIGHAVDLIDMTKHNGQHPRMGAVDVVPFIPIKNMDMEEAVGISKAFAQQVYEVYQIPVFLYEASATNPDRKNLSNIRKGQFEGMAEKMSNQEWTPDLGDNKIHPTAGVCAIGARMPLVAFNVFLDTNRLEVADAIAKTVRFLGGGLRFVKAIGIAIEDRDLVQVSMNLTDYTKTALYQAVEMIRFEAKRYGINVVGSEVVGLVPMAALIESAVFYMGIDNFSMRQVLENNLME